MDLTENMTGIPYDAFVSPPLPVGSSSAAASSSAAVSSSAVVSSSASAASLTLEDVSAIVTTTIKGFLPSLDDEYEVTCPSWLRSKLCNFLGSSDAQFSCMEQAHAMVKVLERKDDLLVVLPTGCGKSLLFQLPAMVERRKMTVVVLPLISLTKDMKRRCTQQGISWEVWRGKCICLHGRA